MPHLLWAIPLLPLAGFAVNGLLGARVLPRRVVALVACSTVLLSFLLSLGAILALGTPAGDVPARITQDLFEWMPLGQGPGGADLTVRWGYTLDALSAVMLLVVTGVGFLIHVYSIGYMEHESRAGFSRFFAYLNLFMAMMLTLVLGSTLPVLFVGWEGVGLCSYLLIGFHYDRLFDARTRMSCADAGRKAFITNRVGDVGFVLGMLLLFTTAGTLDIQEILAKTGALGPSVCAAAALLLFLGACGKSAQIPLYVWLPDAMAGPTPVSALIHAATMVTAGVYMICRMAPLFLAAAPGALTTVAVVGATTALLAALIGIAQDDIKKVLAYSTVSQLGYMVLAAGVGAFSASIFHLMTHAFFKALLFLGAGSVIHALSGEQDIRRMGGLRRHLPFTHATFAVAVLAIAGIPPFAGFFSKDEILWAALTGRGGGVGLWLVAVATAGITAFYMTRLYLLVFAGAPRLSEEAKHHLHESSAVMIVPLLLLAVGSALAGFAGVPRLLGGERLPNFLERYLAPVLHAEGGAAAGGGLAGEAGVTGPIPEGAALLVALSVSLAGIALGWAIYGRAFRPPVPEEAQSRLTRLVKGKFFVDEAIEVLVLRPYRRLCRASSAFDEKVVDALVNAAGGATDLAGQVVRLTQTGYVRNYALVFLLGTVVILLYVLR
ncbi:MAG TPA: NADH-quinone oxidoreductase subunit L [Candidatus Polarisedimenticolia bacterium]|nr:NADH-quinone oxidoreductase subunit L [Candidatus Polarisedimenticolia bacterium]